MGVVVERGSARCPHCVAVADYTFIESGLNVVRYEVHCHSCGEVYSEVNSLVPQTGPVGRNLPIPPFPQEIQPATWRRHSHSAAQPDGCAPGCARHGSPPWSPRSRQLQVNSGERLSPRPGGSQAPLTIAHWPLLSAPAQWLRSLLSCRRVISTHFRCGR
jgi:hypothetical protein